MAPKSASVNAITGRKASAKSSKRMKQIFVGKVFSFSGDFGENWGHEQMANWIRAHGGRYEREVSDDTTHLICTVEHYMLKTVQVKMAQDLGTQCRIVVKDWLEDCLVGHAMQKRCRVETPYTLTQVLKRVGSTRDRQYEYRQKFEQGVHASNELVDNRKDTKTIKLCFSVN
ncbi:hypothetical protein OIDMADRAFT_116894 [Oidiodendron maius Zn]|uniref:BRCT domain-containing protein n=1 Tax=Oidiodendron maius (strain Zn) TaxID=913774 RepID=A0A0C3DNS3_OIDMZ|nr:hypothetical protein OIDMADRAFT_116894 [Oidiodendron maius Zn]